MKPALPIFTSLMSLGFFISASAMSQADLEIRCGKSAAGLVLESSGVSNVLSEGIFPNLLKTSPGKNIMFSPASATVALALTLNGASGTTLTQMETALGMTPGNLAKYNEGFQGLITDLTTGKTDEKINIATQIIANSTRVKFQPSFVTLANSSYLATAQALDFASPATLDTVNAQVSKATDGMISKLLPRLNPSSLALIINALVVKGSWQIPFNKTFTTAADFTKFDGTKMTVQMMSNHQTTTDYAVNATAQMISLPFTQNAQTHTRGRLRVEFILPQTGIKTIVAAKPLDSATLDSLRTNLLPTRIEVSLPRFKLDYGFSLKAELQRLGMADAFGPNADFTRMLTGTGAKIDDVIQKLALDVNENGLAAAAATAVIFGKSAIAGGPIAKFIANRPFMLLIRDTDTGIILFQAQVEAPESK